MQVFHVACGERRCKVQADDKREAAGEAVKVWGSDGIAIALSTLMVVSDNENHEGVSAMWDKFGVPKLGYEMFYTENVMADLGYACDCDGQCQRKANVYEPRICKETLT